MANPVLGQLMLVGFNFAPIGWAQCNGTLLPTSRYSALFLLLKTYYGGNGTTTFGLPNLQGSVAVGFGQGPNLGNYAIGQNGGTVIETLDTTKVPAHTHTPLANIPLAGDTTPSLTGFARSASGNVYNNITSPAPKLAQMSQSAITPFAGGNLPHNNLMPYLTLNWIIALQGVFPTQ